MSEMIKLSLILKLSKKIDENPKYTKKQKEGLKDLMRQEIDSLKWYQLTFPFLYSGKLQKKIDSFLAGHKG